MALPPDRSGRVRRHPSGGDPSCVTRTQEMGITHYAALMKPGLSSSAEAKATFRGLLQKTVLRLGLLDLGQLVLSEIGPDKIGILPYDVLENTDGFFVMA